MDRTTPRLLAARLENWNSISLKLIARSPWLLRKSKVNDNTVITVGKQLFAYRVPASILLNVIAAVSVRAGQSDRANTRDLPYMLVIVTPWILEIATFRKVRELRSANPTRIYQQSLRPAR